MMTALAEDGRKMNDHLVRSLTEPAAADERKAAKDPSPKRTDLSTSLISLLGVPKMASFVCNKCNRCAFCVIGIWRFFVE